MLLDVCDLGDLRLERAAADALSALLLFVLVGVPISPEEPLRWRGVNTHADRPCARRSRRQAERQTGPIATALDWGSARGRAAHWT